MARPDGSRGWLCHDPHPGPLIVAGLSIERAVKRFGAVGVLNDISVDIADGEFAVIVGPSGCGKSTLLRSVAGLEDLTSGRIRIGSRDVTDMQPSQRGIAMVFQSYALYPHLSVFDNMAFGLRIAKTDNAEIDRSVRQAAEILNIESLLDRKPAALSGGQRQRVAIGRAIVRQPQIFLFDEPLSNLDADLRVRMRYEFAQLHRTLGTTTLYVTHDQAEAMTLADRIIVLRDGRVEQVGSPRELYERPANVFVAQFLGTPRMNMLPATVADAATAILADGRSVAIPAAAPLAPGTPVSIGIRPEDVVVGDEAAALHLSVAFVERLGGLATVHLRGPDGQSIACQLRDDGTLREADAVPVTFRTERIHLFDAGENRIAEGASE